MSTTKWHWGHVKTLSCLSCCQLALVKYFNLIFLENKLHVEQNIHSAKLIATFQRMYKENSFQNYRLLYRIWWTSITNTVIIFIYHCKHVCNDFLVLNFYFLYFYKNLWLKLKLNKQYCIQVIMYYNVVVEIKCIEFNWIW